MNDDILIIHKTDKFASYAENESETSINFKVQFRCTQGNTEGVSLPYTFTIYLQVTNDNAPVFPQAQGYNMDIPLPLPANFELTFYGAIFARDIDLGDNQVKFTGGNSYFTVSTIGRSSTSPKEYYVSIKTARQILVLPKDSATFTITATDNGGLTGETSISVIVDPENSYTRDPSPTFESPTYNFRIDKDSNYHNNFIYLTEASFEQGEVLFKLTGSDIKYFRINEEIGRQLNVVFTGEYTEEEFKDKTYLVVELVAEREGYDTGHTTIFVDLPVVCGECEREVYSNFIIKTIHF